MPRPGPDPGREGSAPGPGPVEEWGKSEPRVQRESLDPGPARERGGGGTKSSSPEELKGEGRGKGAGPRPLKLGAGRARPRRPRVRGGEGPGRGLRPRGLRDPPTPAAECRTLPLRSCCRPDTRSGSPPLRRSGLRCPPAATAGGPLKIPERLVLRRDGWWGEVRVRARKVNVLGVHSSRPLFPTYPDVCCRSNLFVTSRSCSNRNPPLPSLLESCEREGRGKWLKIRSPRTFGILLFLGRNTL